MYFRHEIESQLRHIEREIHHYQQQLGPGMDPNSYPGECIDHRIKRMLDGYNRMHQYCVLIMYGNNWWDHPPSYIVSILSLVMFALFGDRL